MLDEAPDQIIKLSDVMKMFENYNDPKFDDSGGMEAGVDVARFGDDSTQMYRRKGHKVVDHRQYNKQDTVFVAQMVVDFTDGDGAVLKKIDDTGVGGGVTDNLNHLGFERSTIPINFNNKAEDEDKYANAISEMWFTAAKLIREHRIACKADNGLKAELINRKMKPLDSKGRRVVESKEDYKKRGFRSPDKADAFLLTFYNKKKTFGAYIY